MSAQNQTTQVQGQRVQDLVEMLRRLDNNQELGRKELKEVIKLIDYMDELYESSNTSGVEVNSSTEFKLVVKKMPDEPLWLVYTCEDDSWYRVGEANIEDDVMLVRNFSEAPQTKEKILVEDSVAVEAFKRAMRLNGDETYDCADFWVKNVKTEAFKCVSDEVTMYIIAAPHIVYVVHVNVKARKARFAVVKDRGAVKAFHVLFNVPL